MASSKPNALARLLFVIGDTPQQMARIANEECGTAWNGSVGWVFWPPLSFVVACLVVLARMPAHN